MPKVVGSIPVWTIHWRAGLDTCGSLHRILCDYPSLILPPSINEANKWLLEGRSPLTFFSKLLLMSPLLPFWCTAPPVGWAEEHRVWGLSEPQLSFFHTQYGQYCHKWWQSSREKCLLHSAFIHFACVSVCPVADGRLAMADATPIPDPEMSSTDLFSLAIRDRIWWNGPEVMPGEV